MASKKSSSDWEKYYQDEKIESMPWYIEGIDNDFSRTLNELSIKSGDVLDLGTGPGTQAIALANTGFKVTATDISISAVNKAKIISKEKSLNINFIKDDILDSKLNKQFDIVFDRGCFHLFTLEQRKYYIDNIVNLVKPNGYLLLKCFSHLEKSDEGPSRFTPKEIEDYFSNSFKVCSIKDSVFQGTLSPFPKALVCILQKY